MTFIADLSFWYTYPELATRGGIFWGSTSLASAFNGLVSYGIQTDLNGKNGWRPWRWIFCIEGIMPIVFGLLLFVFLPSTPETARFGFTQADKELAVKRSRRAHNPEDAKLRPQKILTVLLNPIFWFFTLIFSAYHYCNAPMTNFIPNIVQARSHLSSISVPVGRSNFEDLGHGIRYECECTTDVHGGICLRFCWSFVLLPDS
jgi:MFS family permease